MAALAAGGKDPREVEQSCGYLNMEIPFELVVHKSEALLDENASVPVAQ